MNGGKFHQIRTTMLMKSCGQIQYHRKTRKRRSRTCQYRKRHQTRSAKRLLATRCPDPLQVCGICTDSCNGMSGLCCPEVPLSLHRCHGNGLRTLCSCSDSQSLQIEELNTCFGNTMREPGRHHPVPVVGLAVRRGWLARRLVEESIDAESANQATVAFT